MRIVMRIMTSLNAAFQSAARRNRDEVALRDGDITLTFDELFDQSSRLAHSLREAGVRPGDRVMLSMGNRAGGVLAVAGALLAGAVVAPTNPGARRRELLHWAGLVQPTAIIAEAEPLAELYSEEGPTGLRLTIDGSDSGAADLDLSEAITRGEPGDGHAPEPSDPALVLFTSGTTGLSKGVTRTHDVLVRFLRAWHERVVRPDDVVLNYLPLNH